MFSDEDDEEYEEYEDEVIVEPVPPLKPCAAPLMISAAPCAPMTVQVASYAAPPISLETGVSLVLAGVGAISKKVRVHNYAQFPVKIMIHEDPEQLVKMGTSYNAGLKGSVKLVTANLGGESKYQAEGFREPTSVDIGPGRHTELPVSSSKYFVRAGFFKGPNRVQVFWECRPADWEPGQIIQIQPHHDQPSNNVYEDIRPGALRVDMAGESYVPPVAALAGPQQFATLAAIPESNLVVSRMPTFDERNAAAFIPPAAASALKSIPEQQTCVFPNLARSTFRKGERVEVFCRTDGGWISGEVVETQPDGTVSVSYPAKRGLSFKTVPPNEIASHVRRR